MSMIIRYENSDKAWSGISDFIEGIMHRHGAKSILEIGAGANPLFSLDFAKRHNLSYTILDISLEELAKAPSGYRTIHSDIGAKDFSSKSDLNLYSAGCLQSMLKMVVYFTEMSKHF